MNEPLMMCSACCVRTRVVSKTNQEACLMITMLDVGDR